MKELKYEVYPRPKKPYINIIGVYEEGGSHYIETHVVYESASAPEIESTANFMKHLWNGWELHYSPCGRYLLGVKYSATSEGYIDNEGKRVKGGHYNIRFVAMNKRKTLLFYPYYESGTLFETLLNEPINIQQILENHIKIHKEAFKKAIEKERLLIKDRNFPTAYEFNFNNVKVLAINYLKGDKKDIRFIFLGGKDLIKEFEYSKLEGKPLEYIPTLLDIKEAAHLRSHDTYNTDLLSIIHKKRYPEILKTETFDFNFAPTQIYIGYEVEVNGKRLELCTSDVLRTIQPEDEINVIGEIKDSFKLLSANMLQLRYY